MLIKNIGLGEAHALCSLTVRALHTGVCVHECVCAHSYTLPLCSRTENRLAHDCLMHLKGARPADFSCNSWGQDNWNCNENFANTKKFISLGRKSKVLNSPADGFGSHSLSTAAGCYMLASAVGDRAIHLVSHEEDSDSPFNFCTEHVSGVSWNPLSPSLQM